MSNSIEITPDLKGVEAVLDAGRRRSDAFRGLRRDVTLLHGQSNDGSIQNYNSDSAGVTPEVQKYKGRLGFGSRLLATLRLKAQQEEPVFVYDDGKTSLNARKVSQLDGPIIPETRSWRMYNAVAGIMKMIRGEGKVKMIEAAVDATMLIAEKNGDIEQLPDMPVRTLEMEVHGNSINGSASIQGLPADVASTAIAFISAYKADITGAPEIQIPRSSSTFVTR